MTLALHSELQQAAQKGDVQEVVRLVHILGYVPEHVMDAAVNKNHPLVVRELVAVAGSGEDVVRCICMAAEWGFLECVKELVDYCEPDEIGYALGDAASEGRLEVVQYLIPLCDLKANESHPLQMACIGGNTSMIEYLYPFSDPHVALEELKKIEKIDTPAVVFLRQLIENERQNARLHEQINSVGVERSRKL